MCIAKYFPEQVNELNADNLLDKVEFTGEWTSLNTELPLIQEWFNSSEFSYQELSNHVEFLNRKKTENNTHNRV